MEKEAEFSDLTKEEYEREMEGDKTSKEEEDVPIRFATGYIDIPEEEKILSPEDEAYLNSSYDELSRANIPNKFDARESVPSSGTPTSNTTTTVTRAMNGIKDGMKEANTILES